VAILPIDLQTLYTQMDKVGKTQAHQQLAAQVAQEAKMTANRTLTEQKLKSVQETQAGSEQTGVVHRRDGQDARQDAREETGYAPGDDRDGDDKAETVPEPKKEVIRDLALGNNIDITG